MNRLAIVLSGLLFFSPQGRNPQGPQRGAVPASPDNRGVINVVVDRINVPFTVVDKKGKPIVNLRKEDFRVYEDNKLQTISNFSNDANLPLAIALVMDTSASIRKQLEFEQESAIDFFRNALKRGRDRGALITFDQAVDVKQDFTDDAEALTAAVQRIKVGRTTSMFDALYLTTTEKLAKQPGDFRRLIVLISDGDDNSVNYSEREAMEVLQKNDVTVYAISTNTSIFSNTDNKGNDVLKRLAGETGGVAFFPEKLEDLAVKFRTVVEELRLQYAVVYRPTNTVMDGKLRRVRIEVPGKDYTVRARKSYYATRPETTPEFPGTP